MFQNVSIYIVPFVIGFFVIVLSLAISSIGTLAAIGSRPQATFIFLFAASIFFSLFLYYVLVYMIASAVGNWFYMQGGLASCAGCPGVISHFGSFTFAALIITFIKVLRAIVDYGARNTDNFLCCLCLCLTQCFLASVEALLQAMNHYAVIMMSYTGYDFINSAKTATVILFS